MRILINEKEESTGVRHIHAAWDEEDFERERMCESVEELILFLMEHYGNRQTDLARTLAEKSVEVAVKERAVKLGEQMSELSTDTESWILRSLNIEDRLQKLEKKQESIHRLEERILEYERGRAARIADLEIDVQAFAVALKEMQGKVKYGHR